MAILAVIDVDDAGTLKVQNFKDALVDLGATVKKTDTEMGSGQGAPKFKDALSQLTEEARRSAVEVVKNSAGFGVLSSQLQQGVTVTKLQADALQQLGASASQNAKFTQQYGAMQQSVNSTLQAGTVVTKAQAAQLQVLAQGYNQTAGGAGVANSALQNFKETSLATTAVLGILTYNATGLLKEAGLLAGRVETLGIVMNTMARNSTVTSLEMQAQAVATAKLGITTQEARSAVIQFAQANLDISKTSQIARAAQDLAVVAGENSTQTFNRLTTAIQIQQPMLLRQVGIVTGLKDIYEDYARSLGKTWRELDQTEKKQAFVNRILEEGEKVTGAYEASMTSAFKQIGSFSRFVEEAKLKLGEGLLPVMLTGVTIATSFLKAWIALPAPIQAFVTAILAGSTAIATFATAVAAARLIGLIDVFMRLREAFQLFIIGVQAGMGPLTAAIAAFGALQVAMGALVVVLGIAAAAYIYFTSQAVEDTKTQFEHAAAIEANIVSLEQAQKKYNTASEAIAKQSKVVDELTGKTSLSRAEQEKLAFTTDQLELNKVKLHSAELALVKLSPSIQRALNDQSVATAELNRLIDETIAKKKTELLLMAEVFQRKLTDAEQTEKDTEAARAASALQVAAAKDRIKALEEMQKAGKTSVQMGTGLGPGEWTNIAQAIDQAKNSLKILDGQYVESASAAGQATAKVRELTESVDALRKAGDDNYAAQQTRKDKQSLIGQSTEAFEAQKTTIQAALKLIGKSVDDLYDNKLSVARVKEILGQASEAWDEHQDKATKANERIAKANQQLYESITGDSAKLKGQLGTVNRALGEVAHGSDEYVSRLLRAKEIVQSSTSLTDKETEAFKNLRVAQIDLQKVKLEETLEKYRDKAKEVTEAFQEMATSGIIKLREDFEKMNESADKEALQRQKDFNRQMTELDRDLYERAVVSKMSEVDQKIYQNDRYYASLQEDLDRQVELLEQQTQDELDAIARRTKAEMDALDEAKRRAELRFKIEVETETAIAKIRRQLEDAKNKTPAQIESEIRAVADELRASLTVIHTAASESIFQINKSQVAAAGERAKVRQGEIEDIRAKQIVIEQVNTATNEHIRREMALTRQILGGVMGTVVDSFAKGFMGIITGAMSFKDMLLSIFNSLKNALFNIVDGFVQKWIGGLGKVLAGTAGNLQGGFLSKVGQAAGFIPSTLPGFGAGGAGVGFGTLAGEGGAAAGGAGGSSGFLGAAMPFAIAGGAGFAGGMIGKQIFGGAGWKAGGFGAGTGAAVGSIFGPVGAAVGGLVGLISGLVGKSVSEKIRDTRDALADEFQVIDEKGRLVKSGFDEVNRILREAGKDNLADQFIHLDQMKPEAAQRAYENIVKALNQIAASKAFEEIAKGAGGVERLRRSMTLMGADFEKLKNAQNMDEVNAEMETFNKLLEASKVRLDGLSKAAGGLSTLTKGFGGTVRRDLDKITGGRGADVFSGDFKPEQSGELTAATERAQAEFTRLGTVATAVFAGILADTGDIVQAINAISPAIDDLIEIQKALGLEASGAFEQLINFRKVILENADVAESLSGITQILTGLTEAGIKNQAVFDAMGGSAAAQFDILTARGVDANQILMLMQPTLQALYEAQKQFGYATDDATQKLIDMGLEQGVIGDNMQSVNKQILDVLIAIGEALGATLPEAYRKARKAADENRDAAVLAAKAQEEAARNAARNVDDLTEATKRAKHAWNDLGSAAYAAGRTAEDAATGAAEGHSPTGMKQLVLRTREAMALMRQLRVSGGADLRAIEGAAADASRGFDGFQEAGPRVAADPNAVPPAPTYVTIQHTSINKNEFRSFDPTDLETIVKDKLNPVMTRQHRANTNQLAEKTETALRRYRR